MMTPILLIVACILLAGFYAGAETGAYRLNRVRLRSRAEAGLRTARLTESLTADMERFVTMTLVASNAAVYGATVFCTALVASRVRNDLVAELVSTLILAPLLLIFAEVIPKSLFQVLANPLMRAASAFLWVSDKLLEVEKQCVVIPIQAGGKLNRVPEPVQRPAGEIGVAESLSSVSCIDLGEGKRIRARIALDEDDARARHRLLEGVHAFPSVGFDAPGGAIL